MDNALLNYAGMVVLITGASSGIGRATAPRLRTSGCAGAWRAVLGYW